MKKTLMEKLVRSFPGMKVRTRKHKFVIDRLFLPFIAMVAGLLFLQRASASFYVDLFKSGAISYADGVMMHAATFAVVSGLTVYVGARYLIHIRSIPHDPFKIFGKKF